MKWYCVFTNLDEVPIDWDKFAAADCIFTFSGALALLPPERCRGKLLVAFFDKLFVGRSFMNTIGHLNRLDCDVILDIPPSGLYEAEIRAMRRLVGVIQRGTPLPWAHQAPQVTSQRRFLHFARQDPRFEGYVKGTDYVLELLEEFPHDIIGDVQLGNFHGWVSIPEQLRLHCTSRLLLHPSRLDSSSRTLIAAMTVDQVAVLALREAEYTLALSEGRPPQEYLPQFFPLARDKQEFQDLVRRLMTDDELYEAYRQKLREYKTRHPLYWDSYAIYEAFAELGLPLPRDLTPLHLLLVSRESIEALPAGPWDANGASLNYV